jgi:pimeloyl-ACP methyl ester carboxylesterase
MKYMLLIYTDEQAWTDAERQHCFAESTELAHQLKANGQYLATAPLQPVSTATSVQVRDGKRLVTDGPFAETREQLGGYEVQGSGPVLLMIPGGPTDAGIFAGLAGFLADRYTVVPYDPRGNSRSVLDGPPEDQRMDLHGDDAAQLPTSLSGEPAYVLGSSGGA